MDTYVEGSVAIYIIAGGSHNLNAGGVVTHILHILEDPFTCSAFGLDHSSILLKDILRVRAYWQHINQDNWQSKYVYSGFQFGLRNELQVHSFFLKLRITFEVLHAKCILKMLCYMFQQIFTDV